MKLVLVRHVETFGNVERRLNGHTESQYTRRGEAMKELLVEELIALDEKLTFDKIYASPTSRAFKIAADVGAATGKQIQVDNRLQEFNFGIFEGKTSDECSETAKTEWDLWMDDYLDYVVPEGQSQREYHTLCKEFLAELNPDETVLLVAHGGTVHGMLTNLLELPIDSKWHFDIKLGSITVVNYNDGFGMLSTMMTPAYDELIVDQPPLGEANISIMKAAVAND
ncbi:histidine phosphatase family protein [Acetobacterium paludosum]|uniref:Histidine phosphatase family protein n=1 Tax=Acetobacterium paludosum TaxID=52693 RepID=A0A923KYL4_9FIRM|nr:histidine phosphatase family protein [Acetobacterium paludosum]MBC3889821.1 histidine phosphatase family protein [Acetobacterium paludosum]